MPKPTAADLLGMMPESTANALRMYVSGVADMLAEDPAAWHGAAVALSALADVQSLIPDGPDADHWRLFVGVTYSALMMEHPIIRRATRSQPTTPTQETTP